MTKRLIAILWVLVLGVLVMALPAHAQPSAADKAAAEALFDQAKALLDKDTAKACEKLDASERLDPAVGTLLFLGDCYEKLGKKASAWATFKEAVSLAERQGDQRKKIADVRAAALQPQVSFLKVNVASPVEGLVVRRGGIEVGRASWGSPLPTDAGSQLIEATAPGKQRWTTTIEVKDGGETFSVDVPALTESAEPAPQPAPTVPAPRGPAETADDGSVSPLIIAGAVIAGVGVVGLVLGGVFGGLANSSNQDSLDHCPRSPTLCDATGVDLRDEAKSRATVSTAMFIVGGVLAGGGIVLIVLGATSSKSEQAWLSPSVGPGQAGLVMRGRF